MTKNTGKTNKCYRYLDANPTDPWKISELESILSEGIFFTSSLSRFNDIFECGIRFRFGDKKKFKYYISKLPAIERRRFEKWLPCFDSVGPIMKHNESLIPKLTSVKYAAMCFSKSRRSPALWGLYAAKGTGICVETERLEYSKIDGSKCCGTPALLDRQMPDNIFHDVIYSEQRPTLDAWEFVAGNFEDKYADDFTRKLFLHKSIVWQHEEEVRIVADNETCKINLPVTRVLFGPKMPEIKKRYFLKKYPNINFVSTHASEDSFNVAITINH